MRTSRRGARHAYKPGQLTPISGIYTAVHAFHRRAHDILAIRGEELPFCRTCEDRVRFYVQHVAPHMTHDLDLAGPLRFDILASRTDPRKRAS